MESTVMEKENHLYVSTFDHFCFMLVPGKLDFHEGSCEPHAGGLQDFQTHQQYHC